MRKPYGDMQPALRADARRFKQRWTLAHKMTFLALVGAIVLLVITNVSY